MPIYEYRCDACGNVFEEWRRHADGTTEAACHGCGKSARRLISNTSFVLKGGGWYVTEYGNRKKDSSAETPAASSTPGSEAKAETAAATSAPAPAVSPPAASAPATAAAS